MVASRSQDRSGPRQSAESLNVEAYSAQQKGTRCSSSAIFPATTTTQIGVSAVSLGNANKCIIPMPLLVFPAVTRVCYVALSNN